MMTIWKRSAPLAVGLQSKSDRNDLDMRVLSELLKLNYHDTRETVSNEKAARA